MRTEKIALKEQISEIVKASSLIVLIDFTGLKVAVFSELRKRLRSVNCRCLVLKNTLLRLALKEAKMVMPQQNDAIVESFLKGPTAILFSEAKDVAGVAKVLKNFIAEFQLPKVKGAFMENALISEHDFLKLAELPSLEVLRGQLLGTLQLPAVRLVRLLNEPATALARLVEIYSKKEN
ncbi:50S ribosomal protein L10 [Candidatus Methylacidiphilum fumarolicum]|uniref:Large ribosomal subunit protein uL10 n=2 Tax=Candidatus Methylacidiphilum fumarolicum TaxID=591154 RepID=I0JX24_METFB|nr:50S ribosomal protein L10 [Candidatus Methylacidiphilum fumarolicum]MBW6414484.1 50S ribosomal protein L10 [Candidatus Methylacidiphilum fumarolicum]TFE69482.1 50S ribosomal protein L10 [Candidatus Methylacidiphilum fumarolicum]CAI9085400.1 50S ribosomal protein L10 [Candidatus Methylacidiphilum fumarolicum]CCG91793.1 Ribosomal protein L10 [Methylacidiphilum fumariolicum SolV]